MPKIKLMKRYRDGQKWFEVENLNDEKQVLSGYYTDVDLLFEEPYNKLESRASFRTPWALYCVYHA